jgi:flagellar biosynthesis protein FlhB
MASPDSGQERTEDATPKRRRDARRKGTVAKSQDISGAVMILSLLLVFPAAAAMMGRGFMSGMTNAYRGIPEDASLTSLWSVGMKALQPTLPGLAILAFTLLATGVAANFAQVGFVLSAESMNPQFKKINPLEGLKRLFSRQSTFNGLKAMAKTGLFAYLAWSTILANLPTFANLSGVPTGEALAATADVLRQVALKLAGLWIVLAAIDYFFQRKQVEKQLKMTKQEVKQEMKEAETSPELRSARMQRARKLSKSRMMDAVKTADVVVTNPTHFAVALRYRPGEDHAPTVVAKGQDLLAAKIRELAASSRVPIVPNPPLARALYRKCEVGEHVPRELFQAVAEVLAYVYRTLKKVS